MIIAERTDTAIPISITLTKFGLVTGATVTGAIYDPVTTQWLDNWSTGTWNAAKQTEPLTEGDTGRYLATANMSNASSTTHFIVYFEVTAGGEGASEEILVLSNEVYDVADATNQSAILTDTGTTLPATLSGLATQSSVDVVDTNVDAILVDTGTTIPAQLTSMSGAGFLTGTDSLEAIRNRVDTVPTAGQNADAVWEEPSADHLTAGTEGYLQDQAATGGAGVTPLQIEQAVWGALQASYQASGTMGKAVADSSSLPADLTAALNRYFQTVRKYGPQIAKQPLVGKDEVHAGDVGHILTIPVVLDGAYADLSDATSITFHIQAPGAAAADSKAGLGVTTSTGSYTTWTTDNTVFTTTGRWLVDVLVTWPDTTTKQSLRYSVDVQPPLPVL